LTLVSLNIFGRQSFDPSGSDEAIFNIEDLVPGKNRVEYLSEGSRIVAHLYLPDNYTTNETYPTIVVAPPNTGVKEQTAGLYAEKLSERGFITLAFDPRGFGESGGHHVLFDLERQVEDVRSSIDFVSELDMVDQDNIFNMGICVGSAISTYETASDPRIKAQIMVSPVFITADENPLPMPRDLGYIIGGAAKFLYATTGYDMELGPLVQENPSSEDEPETSLGAGMDDYYLPDKPGYAPTWDNHFSMISIKPVMEWMDFFSVADRFNSTPIYMVYGTEAFSQEGAEKFYDMVDGPKDRLVLEDAGHFDIYWMPEYVDPAVDGIDEFLIEYIER
jgi:fermentation-respiration switch protein FrsA (DUF1100 family)